VYTFVNKMNPVILRSIICTSYFVNVSANTSVSKIWNIGSHRKLATGQISVKKMKISVIGFKKVISVGL